ncbi:MAG: hypothetical protein OEL89_00820 [Candidatus Peregrinibacteria bacterium]|nr:hypothetical protein [Candidatus Peregrinibacteria bacterium]
MEIALTWNLVLLATFVMLFAYNFLLGQSSTVKLILSMYIAIFTADGIASVLKKFFFEISPGFQKMFGEHEIEIFTTVRLGLFMLAIVIFVVKGGFHIKLEKHKHWAARTGIHAGFALLSSLLFLATILIYLSGNSFVEGMIHANEISIYYESGFARILIDYYQFWFSLPAVAFLATSFLFEPKD